MGVLGISSACGPALGEDDGSGAGEEAGAETRAATSEDGATDMASTTGAGETGAATTAVTSGGRSESESTGDGCRGFGPDCVEGEVGGACGDILFPPECNDGVWSCPVGTVSPFDCSCYFLEGLLCLEGPPQQCGAMVDAVCEDGWVCPRGSTPAEECADAGSSGGTDGGSTGDTSTGG